jgi:hypothetical protein
MENGPGTLARILPAEARYVLDWLRAALGNDRGEVGIVGTIIMVVGFAVAAVVLVAAITGKLNAWIAKIPG